MSPNHPARPRRSPLLLSLLTLLAIVVGLAGSSAQAASAPTLLGLETAVGRSAPLTTAHVRPSPPRPLITRRTAAFAYDRIAVATGVAAKAGGEGLDGASRTYIRITKGGSVRNIGTDMTHTEFAETLTAQGWSSRTVGEGRATLFEKDGARYSLREHADSYDGWTADYRPAGAKKTTLKIRLGYRP